MIAVTFGVLLILLLEGSLRLAGYGGHPPLLEQLGTRPDGRGGKVRLVQTPGEFTSIFFRRAGADGSLVKGSTVTERFESPKPAEVFRVVVVGESTIQGFPLPRNLTASAFLRELMLDAMPGRRVEVLNLGATAVASYPIRRMGEAALAELEPDALVVYGAHNEFFGASGVASYQRLGTSVTAMAFNHWLRQTAMMDLVGWTAMSVARKAQEAGTTERTNLISRMAGTEFVEPGGALHDAARRTLETNWIQLAAAAKAAGVPIVFCTVASNEADMAPMVSSTEALAPAVLAEVEAVLTDAATTGTVVAVERLEAVSAQAPEHALLRYRLAQALAREGSMEDAAEQFRQARDLDALPWRAARDKNDAIRRVAEQSGAVLADAEAAFGAEAGGATGWDLFDDHLHPSLRGQGLLAETIFRAMRDAKLLPGVGSDAEPRPFAELAGRQGAHYFEWFRVASMMSALFKNPPLRLNNHAAEKRFREAHQKILKEIKSNPAEHEGAGRWGYASREVGKPLDISYFMAGAALRHGDYEAALSYARAARLNATPYSDQMATARLLELLAMVGTGRHRTEQFPATLKVIITDVEFAGSLPGNSKLLVAYSLAGLYLIAGDKPTGESHLQRVNTLVGEAEGEVGFWFRELPSAEVMLRIVGNGGR